MSSFTGKSDNILARKVAGDGFYPDLSFGDFQRDYRVPAEYNADMVANELEEAAGEVAANINTQRLAWEAVPYSSLKAAESGENKPLTQWYFRAVYCRAKASLLRQFPTMTRRAVAENMAKESEETESFYLAKSTKAERRLRGVSGISAELL